MGGCLCFLVSSELLTGDAVTFTSPWMSYVKRFFFSSCTKPLESTRFVWGREFDGSGAVIFNQNNRRHCRVPVRTCACFVWPYRAMAVSRGYEADEEKDWVLDSLDR